MIACIQLSTGLLIEAHGCVETPDDLKTQIANRDGINIADLEEREMSDAEIKVMIESNRLASLTYAQKRAAAYPPTSDYLDAIVKGDDKQRQVYIDACLAVKTKYPKS